MPATIPAPFAANCTNIALDLRDDGHAWLTANCPILDKDGKVVKTVRGELNLDKVIGNHMGRLVWGNQSEQEGFSRSADKDTIQISSKVEFTYKGDAESLTDQDMVLSMKKIQENATPHLKTVLSARLHLPDGAKRVHSIYLDDHIKNENGELVARDLPRRRTLVLCFDGTGDSFDDQNTNVVHFMQYLRKNEPSEQRVYYQEGIGTYVPTKSSVVTGAGETVAKAADQAIAMFLEDHVTSGYRFLCQAYQTGDRVIIFGFSRGAHTARAVAGMVHRVGLLPADNQEHVPFAYKLYQSSSSIKEKTQCRHFKETFSMDVNIDFLGVWDTVNSTGNLWPRSLEYTDENPSVLVFRHAIAMDEHRVKFLPSIIGEKRAKENFERRKREGTLEKKEKDLKTDMKEVWFIGHHCDVGGGNDIDGTPISLANIPLRWMIKECKNAVPDILLTAKGMPDTEEKGLKSPIHPKESRMLHRVHTEADDEGVIRIAAEDPAGFITAKQEHPAQPTQWRYNDHKGPSRGALDKDAPWSFKWAMWKTMEYFPTKVQTETDRVDGKNKWRWAWNCESGRVMDHSRNINNRIYIHRSLERRLKYIRQKGIPRPRTDKHGKFVHIEFDEKEPFTYATFNGKRLFIDNFLSMFWNPEDPKQTFKEVDGEKVELIFEWCD